MPFISTQPYTKTWVEGQEYRGGHCCPRLPPAGRLGRECGAAGMEPGRGEDCSVPLPPSSSRPRQPAEVAGGVHAVGEAGGVAAAPHQDGDLCYQGLPHDPGLAMTAHPKAGRSLASMASAYSTKRTKNRTSVQRRSARTKPLPNWSAMGRRERRLHTSTQAGRHTRAHTHPPSHPQTQRTPK